MGFARVVTDYGVLYYLCDVVVDENYRGQGLGKVLVEAIIEHEKLADLLGLLATKDAHSLYEKFGFQRDIKGTAMRKPAPGGE
jgi:GNAT superfamily N-acetyltransferase